MDVPLGTRGPLNCFLWRCWEAFVGGPASERYRNLSSSRYGLVKMLMHNLAMIPGGAPERKR